VETDELPRTARPDKIPQLRPAFSKDGTVTAANASAISDGAAAIVMMRQSEADKRGLKPIAKIVSSASHAHEPEYFTTAPVPAMKKALEKAGWDKNDVDLWEVNEAFAVVPMIAMKELGISHDKLNVNGGACAMGHPIGASGARVLITLLAAMEDRDAKKGMASLCIGGGEGIAMAVERV
jgi:acetyl-CoA C-acetyltransferase